MVVVSKELEQIKANLLSAHERMCKFAPVKDAAALVEFSICVVVLIKQIDEQLIKSLSEKDSCGSGEPPKNL